MMQLRGRVSYFLQDSDRRLRTDCQRIQPRTIARLDVDQPANFLLLGNRENLPSTDNVLRRVSHRFKESYPISIGSSWGLLQKNLPEFRRREIGREPALCHRLHKIARLVECCLSVIDKHHCAAYCFVRHF